VGVGPELGDLVFCVLFLDGRWKEREGKGRGGNG
jgi:hypothetical protein